MTLALTRSGPTTGESVATSFSAMAASSSTEACLPLDAVAPFGNQGRAPVRADQGDVFRREIVHGAGDQMRDGVRLIVAETAAAKLHHHGSLGAALAVGEKRIVGQHEMHAHRLHVAESLNGALEFPFEGPLVIHLFGKIAALPN